MRTLFVAAALLLVSAPAPQAEKSAARAQGERPGARAEAGGQGEAGRQGEAEGRADAAKRAEAERRRVEALRRYVGRYAVGAGLAPVSTLDVTLEGGELWVKPSPVKKRKLVPRGRGRFADEVSGSPYTFHRDEAGRVTGLTFRFEQAEYTAERVELPPPSLKGNVTFRLKGHADASVVALAGTFNQWHESQLLFGREGDGWVCRVDLEPGWYAYKFVVDGQWILDPANPETEEDAAGNLNSLIRVAGK